MMPYALLHHLAHLLKQQSKITIRHHQNLLSLDTPHYLFKALMQQAQSYVYVDTTRLSVAKTPFNLALEKYASNAKILDAFLENEDRILKIALECPHAYKKIRSYLQLEFTGKHSNAILLDMQNKVIEALHFVRETQSYRPVLKNQVLLALQKPHFKRPPLEPLNTPDFFASLARFAPCP
ncbi:Fibronectin/fibrinogen-binding protein [Helicobacter bizzozeronii CCUG 35545]|nr:Fibronectin/fibrinogen-binding protein [Helicobacter bizzozeronii CCUG 35545]